MAASNSQRRTSPGTSPEPWPRGVSREPRLSIGQVHQLVLKEFPALTQSKMRFLENEGLLNPHRAESNFRLYSQADVVRLRYILTQQRDSYRPLKKIRDQLAALDAGHEEEPAPTTRVVSDQGKTRVPNRPQISMRELCELTGASKEQVEEFVKLGLLVPGLGGYFPTRSVAIIGLIHQIMAMGMPARLLRSVRNSADRHVDLVDQCVESTRARGRAGDRERSFAIERDMAQLVCELYQEYSRSQVDQLTQ